MGIYDREYYRREGPSFLGSFANRGMICKWLIGINVIVFVLQLMSRQDVRTVFGPIRTSLIQELFDLDVTKVLEGQVWRLLTYAFLHQDAGGFPMHIVFNMLFLWWFGSDVEDIYGPWEFLAFYLVSAVLGGFAFVVQHFGTGGLCIGASGAVTAVMVLCALHYPTRVILIFFVLPVPIWLFVLFQVMQDLFGLLGSAGGVAFIVHLAGAAFGFLYYKMQWRVLNFWPDLSAWRQQRTRPNLRVYRPEEEETPVPVAAASSPADLDEQLEAKLDAVLEKVARSGQDSLTDSERAILMRASEVYKRRRT